ncbi:MAG: hypothetical protein HC771_08305 [Synechococcales cyanobacterium CRU_2_2]|nr:hypothetical protein [Synechococcales cyanobacterium CRU_2_2]
MSQIIEIEAQVCGKGSAKWLDFLVSFKREGCFVSVCSKILWDGGIDAAL